MARSLQLTHFFLIPNLRQGQPQNLNFPNKFSTLKCCSLRNSDLPVSHTQRLVHHFNPNTPLEEAVTPPTSWYTDPSFFQLELDRVFYTGWQVVGSTEQIKDPLDFFTGRLGDVEFVVCRDDSGKIRAFHNVCRHHASLLASGSGQKSCFVCPYHGWTYGLNGTLLKATRISGMRNFNVYDFGLVPIKVATWGPFVLLNLGKESLSQEEADSYDVAKEWLGTCSEILSTNGVDSSLSYVCRREYTIECNWKVLCDNYLDGGYHVPYAHKDLASGLKLNSYSITVCFFAFPSLFKDLFVLHASMLLCCSWKTESCFADVSVFLKIESSGVLLLDDFEITHFNRPKDKLLDWFFNLVMVLKEQIRVIKLGEGEVRYLEKVVLFGSNKQHLEAWDNDHN